MEGVSGGDDGGDRHGPYFKRGKVRLVLHLKFTRHRIRGGKPNAMIPMHTEFGHYTSWKT
jgi:hypothetical protein